MTPLPGETRAQAARRHNAVMPARGAAPGEGQRPDPATSEERRARTPSLEHGSVKEDDAPARG